MDFNLADDPWLPAVLTDGSVTQMSALSVLLRAREVRSLALDTPSQVPPVLRLLLAVVHRAQQGPADDEEWLEWWKAGAFDAGLIEKYVGEHRPRFDLFDPLAPFLQVGGLQALTGKTKSVALLVPHIASGNNVPLFSAQRDAAPEPMSAAQAARWLVHAHAWDTAAIKTGAVGDPRAKDNKTTGNPVGSLGQLGVVIPTGPTLWHTLMYNLLPADPDDQDPGGEDRPVWEREPLTAAWTKRTPQGRLDLYTWPARRIRLIPEPDPDQPGGIAVRQVLVCGGDRLATDNGQQLRRWMQSEPHTAWKRSTNLERKHTFQPVYWPVRHPVERQLWRGLGPLLAHAQATSPSTGRDAPLQRRPTVLARLGSRVQAAALRGIPIQLLAVGIEYGNKAAVIDEAYADVLPMPVAALAADDRTWRDAILEAVETTARAATALADLASNLAEAAGCRDDHLLGGHRERAREQAYATLDSPFRRWLANLSAEDADPDEALDQWARQIRNTVRRLAGELLAEIPPAAFFGRTVKKGDGTEPMDATIAEIWFNRALRKALNSLMTADDPDEPGSTGLETA